MPNLPPIIPFIVGISAVIIYLLSYQQKKRSAIIAFNVISRALYILQYILLGAFEGAVLDAAGIVASLIAQQKNKPFLQKHRTLFFLLSDFFIIAMGLLLYQNVFSLLPIVGVLLQTGAFWAEEPKKIRIISLISAPFWLAYNLICAAYGSCIGDTLSIVSILSAMYRLDRKHHVEAEKGK